MSASTTKEYHRDVMRRMREGKRLTRAEIQEQLIPEELLVRFNHQHDQRYGFSPATGVSGFAHLSAYSVAHPRGARASIEEIWKWHRSREVRAQ